MHTGGPIFPQLDMIIARGSGQDPIAAEREEGEQSGSMGIDRWLLGSIAIPP